jgi:hypothetical protein
MWFYITDNHAEADRVMRERVMPTIHRPEEMLRERLPVGPAELFAEKLSAFVDAGVQRVFVWPVADEAHRSNCSEDRTAGDAAKVPSGHQAVPQHAT